MVDLCLIRRSQVEDWLLPVDGRSGRTNRIFNGYHIKSHDRIPSAICILRTKSFRLIWGIEDGKGGMKAIQCLLQLSVVVLL